VDVRQRRDSSQSSVPTRRAGSRRA
jgi:hypothetical protein